MATPYENIYKSFLKKIEDKDLPLFSDEEQIEILTDWLNSAISYIELEGIQLVNNLSDRDNDLQQFNTDLLNYEIELIAMYMVVAWYEPKINSLQHILMFVGASGEKWTSQKEHLDMMMNVQESKRLEARKYARNYGYMHNSYIEGS